jgi:hypothetical protein
MRRKRELDRRRNRIGVVDLHRLRDDQRRSGGSLVGTEEMSLVIGRRIRGEGKRLGESVAVLEGGFG